MVMLFVVTAYVRYKLRSKILLLNNEITVHSYVKPVQITTEFHI